MLKVVIFITLAALTAAYVNPAGLPQSINVRLKSGQCPPGEPECAFGCCPIAGGNCCWYGTQCCPPGYTCIVGFCVRSELQNGNITFKSEKAVDLKSQATDCPPGTTTCADEKCCIFPNAVCCSDGLHCCPNGYKCDLAGQRCVKSSTSMLEVQKMSGESLSEIPKSPHFERFQEGTYIICAGGLRRCPSSIDCCINEQGLWSCCPKALSSSSGKGASDCCTTILGYKCCSNYTFCTFFGCL